MQSSSLDYLIPNSIVEMSQLDCFQFDLTLQGYPAAGRWPRVRVWVDQDVVWDNEVVEQTHVKYKTLANKESVCVRIEYYNKSDNDTVVDALGSIVENQHVEIQQVKLNDIDVVAVQTIYQLGHYHMILSDAKAQFFREHGYTTEPNHSLAMFENGEWRLAVPMPVVSNLAAMQSLYEKHEVWIEPQEEVYRKIHAKILNIKALQRKIKEIKCNSDPKQ